MEHDKVVVKSTPDEDEDHEPEDLASGKLADKIPGKDTSDTAGAGVLGTLGCWLGLGCHALPWAAWLTVFCLAPWISTRRTARVPRWKTWRMTMMML